MFNLAPPWTGTTVRIHGINHYYGAGENRRQVLFYNNLQLRRGEIVIMTGPSGSGKTTLLTLIGGLRGVQEGSLQVFGRELAGLEPGELVEIRRDVGFIFQAHNLFDSLTARENVRMALEVRNTLRRPERDRLAVEMLGRLGLARRIHYKPQTLSGGQRQRVAIARALVHRPKLVLADEPTAALDKESGAEVIKLFKQLAGEEGCTILIVTHDNRILDAADRVVHMVDGRVASDVDVEQSVSVCESLARCPAFADKNWLVLTGVSQKLRPRVIPEGRTIVAQGAPAEAFYIIVAGRVRVVGAADQAATGKTLGPGDFFGEAALLTGGPYAASYVAEEDVDLRILSKEAFREALQSSPPFREQLMQAFFQQV